MFNILFIRHNLRMSLHKGGQHERNLTQEFHAYARGGRLSCRDGDGNSHRGRGVWCREGARLPHAQGHADLCERIVPRRSARS